ncbi:MAG: GDYXXLXY domain-containing protein [Blastocatellia bacterium]
MKNQIVFFIAAVALQFVLLLGVPAKKIFTRATGHEIVLKVAPVDPYNVLKGYYVTLGYDISQPSAFANAPTLAEGEVVYAIVERQDDGLWQAVTIERTLPADLPSNQAALRGRWQSGRIHYGIEEFSIPESKRQTVADDLNKNRSEARVDVKVDAQGEAALLRLKIQDRTYE